VEELTVKLRAVLKKRENLLFAYLFGSQTTGNTGKLSDVDVAVYLDPDLGEERALGLSLDIQEQLKKDLQTEKVDVVLLNQAPPLLAHRILRQGKIIFSSDEKARVIFENQQIMRYLDFKPLIQKHAQDVLKKHG